MKHLTTESQGHKKIGENDPRTGSIIGAAISLFINFNAPLLTQGMVRKVL